MSEPTYRDWEEHRPPETHSDLVKRMCHRAEEHRLGYVRLTFVDPPWGGNWYCIEGWATQPECEGPAPTVDDIPVGFS